MYITEMLVLTQNSILTLCVWKTQIYRPQEGRLGERVKEEREGRERKEGKEGEGKDGGKEEGGKKMQLTVKHFR